VKRTRRPTTNLRDHIRQFLRILDIVMEALYGIRHYLYLSAPTADDQSCFKQLALDFGKIWRKDQQLPVPPKLHLLEEHCWRQLSDLGTIGLFLEETMESSHKDDNCLNRIFCNTRDWAAREGGKARRLARESSVAVQELVTQLSGSKRVFSEAILLARSQKQALECEGDEERIRGGAIDARMRVQESRFE
jgi:hypothetical protein